MTLDVRGLVVVDRTGRRIVDDVSFTAGPGEVVALVGPSGAGKTTALHAVLGTLPDGLRIASGTIVNRGTALPASRQWRRRNCGVVGQDPRAALHPLRSVRTIIAETAPSGEAVDASLHTVGLDPDTVGDCRPHELSVGQAQRVTLARALVTDPVLLVLDEPTSGLDAESVRFAVDAVRARRSGVTLLVSHDAAVVADLADHVVRLGPSVAATSEFTSASGPASGPAVLTVEGLNLSHGTLPLLRGTGFTVHAGELVAVLGASGCGKSTLLRALAGLHPVDTGNLTIGDRATPWAVRHRDRDALRSVALVGQSPLEVLNPARRTGAALVRPLRTLRGLDRAAARAEAGRLMSAVGLEPELLERFPTSLSGGQRQRVALARALAGSPTVLLGDEVTASLDDTTATRVLDLLDDVRASGPGVLLVTHEQAVAARADRVLLCVDGSLTN